MFKKKEEDKPKVFVAFRRHIYKGKLFEIGDRLPEGMVLGHGFGPADTDDVDLNKGFINRFRRSKSKNV